MVGLVVCVSEELMERGKRYCILCNWGLYYGVIALHVSILLDQDAPEHRVRCMLASRYAGNPNE